jgi:hypothetical protein
VRSFVFAALGMMEAQNLSAGLGDQGIERRIAAEAKNIVGAVDFRPFHRLDGP